MVRCGGALEIASRQCRSDRCHTLTPSRGQTYVLHRRVTRAGSPQERTLHFFSRDERPDAIDEIPAGYMVVESPRTGLPLLKKA
jgi:hypothetical protein